ncbi:unnamed protein product [Cylindrotheca closterium]|uniref:Glycerol kinase n=1 Tax=Cylindrotheca closterium TaxID=2856 RepID=A0AAD2FQN2_9STRA|nr:unnamed protein product [Cylindrotheca closterium]
MGRDIVLALDIGSSSVRCSAYNLSSNHGSIEKIQSSVRTVSCVRPNSGKIQWYHDNDTLLDIIDHCVDETIDYLRQDKVKFKVSAVGFSSFVMNLIGVDSDGNFVDEEATMSYACNTVDVAKECKAMKDELREDGTANLYQETGAPIHSSYAIGQLRAIYQSSEKYVSRIQQWQTIPSLCLGRWTGGNSLPISFSEASWTGLLNFKTCQYAETALSLLPSICRNSLPELGDVSNPYSTGLPEYVDSDGKRKDNAAFKKWPELRQTSFFLGIGDGACANVGSKAVSESRIAVTIGTSAAARICLPLSVGADSNFQVPQGLFCYRINQNHVLVGGALTDGGSVVEWAQQLLNLSDEDSFLACMKEVDTLSKQDYEDSSLSSNMCMIPFLSGERATGFRGGATGSMIGLTRETTAAHFFKACLEGVTLRLRAVLKLLVDARHDQNQSLPTVVVSGKALEVNELWRQMISDSSGLELVLDSDTFEGTSRGVVRILSHALKAECESQLLVEEAIHPKTINRPRASASKYFNQAAQRHDEFLNAVSPIYTRNDS